MRRLLSQGEPGLFVPIDFGWVNIRLARLAKARGWKVLYFIPPGSWRRDRQGKDLASVTDAVVTPFPWSRDLLSAGGVNTHWFGHPLRQLMRDIRPANESGRVGIAVLPGSRKHEIEANLPLIATSLPDLPATFALAPTVDADRFRREWRALAPERKGDQFVQGRAAEVLAKARLALVCSGTATLEAVLCRCPMVVIYRVNRAMAIEAKVINFKRPKFIALPNILLDEAVVPELVQDEAVDRVIDDLLRRLAPDGEARAKQLVAFERLIDQLGPDQAITETARLAARLLL
jgi:lipid-A-disaccharide synthase